MGSFSIWHWIIVLLIVLLLFGAGKLPSVMGDIAKGVKAFKSGLKDADDETAATPPATTTTTTTQAPHQTAVNPGIVHPTPTPTPHSETVTVVTPTPAASTDPTKPHQG